MARKTRAELMREVDGLREELKVARGPRGIHSIMVVFGDDGRVLGLTSSAMGTAAHIGAAKGAVAQVAAQVDQMLFQTVAAEAAAAATAESVVEEVAGSE